MMYKLSWKPCADSVKMVRAISASGGRGTPEFGLYVSFLVLRITGTEVPCLMKCSWLSASSVYNGTRATTRALEVMICFSEVTDWDSPIRFFQPDPSLEVLLWSLLEYV